VSCPNRSAPAGRGDEETDVQARTRPRPSRVVSAERVGRARSRHTMKASSSVAWRTTTGLGGTTRVVLQKIF
jgi:hypothetical protein